MAVGLRLVPRGRGGSTVVPREPDQRMLLVAADRDRTRGLGHIIGRLLSTSAGRCIAQDRDL